MVGTVTLSIEIELAWGVAHGPQTDPLTRHSPERQKETEMLERLLSVCERLGVPISFDVVGHLLLGSCSGHHDGPHQAGWFDADPGTDTETDPLYYAPDLAQRVYQSPVEHELCTHTFSHVRCDTVEDRVVDWELDLVGELHAERGFPAIRSFVPPVHGPPPHHVLADHGIRTVRKPVTYRPPVENTGLPARPLKRLAWRASRSHPVEMFLRSPAIRDPEPRDGLVETYTSWHASLSAPYLQNGQQPPHPIYGVVPRALRQRHHRRYLLAGLREVAESESSVHYWSHLFNIANDIQWPPIRSFLETLAAYRDQGAIRIETMGELGRRVT